MPTKPSDEVIPDHYIRVPSQIEDKQSRIKYDIQYAIRLGTFSYNYGGINVQTKNEIIFKYISPNSVVIVDAIMKIFNDNKDASKYILPFISTSICKMNNTPFMIMEGGWNNLRELINWTGPKIFNPESFITPAVNALTFLHNNHILHRNLKTSSFWYRQESKCKGNPRCHLLCVEQFVIGDYEECFITNKSLENSKPLPPTVECSVEIQDISQMRKVKKLDSLKYCSLKNHYGSKFKREHDFESLCYILFELYEHRLPWEDMYDKEDVIIERKLQTRSPEYSYFYNTPEYLAELIILADLYESKNTEKPSQLIEKTFEGTIQNYMMKYNPKKSNEAVVHTSEYVKKAGIFRKENNIPTIYNMTHRILEQIPEKKVTVKKLNIDSRNINKSNLKKENKTSAEKRKSLNKSNDKRRLIERSIERKKPQEKSVERKKSQEKSVERKKSQEKSVERKKSQEKSLDNEINQLGKKENNKTERTKKKSVDIKRSDEEKIKSSRRMNASSKDEEKKLSASIGLFKKLFKCKE